MFYCKLWLNIYYTGIYAFLDSPNKLMHVVLCHKNQFTQTSTASKLQEIKNIL